MKIYFRFWVICALFFSGQLFAQAQLFKETSERSFTKEELFIRANQPKEFKIFRLQLNDLFEKIQNLPELSNQPSPVTIGLPAPDGSFQNFYLYDNSAMEGRLAAQVPKIRSIKAVNTENTSHNLNISISDIFGLHAMGNNADGSIYYIDNYTNDLNSVIVYNRTDLEAPNQSFECFASANNFNAETNALTSQVLSLDNKKRTFRLALACTTEYAAFHINNAPNGTPNTTDAQKKNIVLAAMNVSLTRLNQIFERELNVHLNLIANNKDLIFIDSDNFSNNDAFSLISQSQTVIDQIIGTAHYDMGHTFSTGGGGLATLASVCNSWSKAQGITGSPAPVGDPYTVDYVAHEMGHQFGANHTFNNSCQLNRNNTTAMETGSGSTIMSYAGICPANVQSNVDDYYHYISIWEMQTFLQNNASCAQLTTIANSAPVVAPLETRTIPYGTPFILKTAATDADGDVLTYTFEQTDAEITTQPPLANATSGPNFRSVAPNVNNYRSFPDEATVLAGTTNADDIVSNPWEQLSNTARNYTFVATVRDNNPSGGRVVYTPPVTISIANVGPFVITYPNNNPTINEPVWHTGTTQTITWNVAGTDANNINVSHVNILISTDGGATYLPLASNTPNDGNETVTLPTTLPNTTQGRIKIEAIDNIFYTVSKRLTIWDPNMSNDAFALEDLKIYPNPAKDVLNISFRSEQTDQTIYTIFDLNGRLLKTEERAHNDQTPDQITIDALPAGTYLLNIRNGNSSSGYKFVKQ